MQVLQLQHRMQQTELSLSSPDELKPRIGLSHHVEVAPTSKDPNAATSTDAANSPTQPTAEMVCARDAGEIQKDATALDGEGPQLSPEESVVDPPTQPEPVRKKMSNRQRRFLEYKAQKKSGHTHADKGERKTSECRQGGEKQSIELPDTV